MVWTQKSADTTNKFSTEKERKKRHENNLSNKAGLLSIDLVVHVSIYLRMLLALIVRCLTDFVK